MTRKHRIILFSSILLISMGLIAISLDYENFESISGSGYSVGMTLRAMISGGIGLIAMIGLVWSLAGKRM